MNTRPLIVLQILCALALAAMAGCAPQPPVRKAPAARASRPAPEAETGTPATPAPETAAPTVPEPVSPPDQPAPAEKAVPEKVAPKPEEKPIAEAKPEPVMEAKPAPAAEQPGAAPAEAKPDAAVPAKSDPAAPAAAGSAADWPMWGGTIHRNMYTPATPVSIDFEPAEDAAQGKGLLWVSKLGSQTYGNPVVVGGKVFVGTNNGGGYRPKHKGDRGCVLCFEEKTGKFLWQLTREKLPQGQVNDWPDQGICSTVAVEGDRMYVVTNRCELMCVDTEGFADGENDGPFQDETDTEKEDADIVWNLDMMGTLGVFPHNMTSSSPVVYGDLVYTHTSNGVADKHDEIPAPKAPSFLAVNKKTGAVAWQSNAPADKILHGQWSSPALGIVDGEAQVYFPGGDGWLYAFDAKTGEERWRFDLNPKDAKYEGSGRGTRNYVIATPVFFENSVVLATGQDPEMGDGVGHLWRIAVSKRGDVSAVTPDNQPNPNSASLWHLGGMDTDGAVTGKKDNDIFRRTLSTVAIHDGLVYAADLSGRVHCVDFATGKRYWEADVLAAIWGSCLVADGKVFIGNEDGVLTVFAAGKELKKLKEFEFPSSIYSTPTIANGVLFVSDRSRLYAIATR